jgi:TonB family protein
MKALVVLVTVSMTVGAAAQEDRLEAARELYASDAYRAFCLMALGRTAEAESIAESLVRADPTLKIDRYRDASPRIAAMFTTVRARVLPQLIRDEYRAARALASAKAPEAQARLTRVRELLTEAQRSGAWDDTLADLRVLVDGFLELSGASAPAAASAPTPPAVAASLNQPAATGAKRAPAAASRNRATAAASPNGSPAAPITATAGEPGVIAPVALSQPAPQMPPGLVALVKRLQRTGTIDIIIDEHGSVEDVIVKQSVNSAYDALVVAAARTWKYQPALKDGVPVRFIKTIHVKAE